MVIWGTTAKADMISQPEPMEEKLKRLIYMSNHTEGGVVTINDQKQSDIQQLEDFSSGSGV